MNIRELLNTLLPSKQWKIFAIVAGGIVCGLGAYTVYVSKLEYAVDTYPKGQTIIQLGQLPAYPAGPIIKSAS